MSVLATIFFCQHSFFSRHFAQLHCSLPLFCITPSFWQPVSYSRMCLCSRTMLSDTQTSIASAYNLQIWWLFCGNYMWEHAKSYLALSECILLPTCLLSLQMFRCGFIIANFAIGVSWTSWIGTEPTFIFWILQRKVCQHCFSLPGQDVFNQILLVSAVAEPLGNILCYVV